MNVYYGLTRNLYPYLKWSITSLLEHNEDVRLFIFAEDEELPFGIPCEHKVFNVSNQTYYGASCRNLHSRFTYMPMLRVCLPELLDIDKVISLDVDTIICDSLKPLWDIDLTDKWIAWCAEHRGNYNPFNQKYYNSGVAVLNLDQMRKDDVTKKAVELLNYQYFPYTDQDVMNLYAVPQKTVDIDVRFNESFCCGKTDNPAIVHYAGIGDWYRNETMYRHEYLDKYKG